MPWPARLGVQQKFSSENAVVTLSGGARIEAAKSESRMCTPKSQVVARRGRGHWQWSGAGSCGGNEKLKKQKEKRSHLDQAALCSWIWCPTHEYEEVTEPSCYAHRSTRTRDLKQKLEEIRSIGKLKGKIKISHSKCKNWFFSPTGLQPIHRCHRSPFLIWL
jgi:hypothetical protein